MRGRGWAVRYEGGARMGKAYTHRREALEALLKIKAEWVALGLSHMAKRLEVYRTTRS